MKLNILCLRKELLQVLLIPKITLQSNQHVMQPKAKNLKTPPLVAKNLLKKFKENTNLPKIKTSIAQDIQESLIYNLLFPHFLSNQTKQENKK